MTKAADDSDKNGEGLAAISATVLSRIAAAPDVRQAALLALADSGQQVAAGRSTLTGLLSAQVQTTLHLPAPTDAQVEVARARGLPPAMAAMVSVPHGINAFGHGFSQVVHARASADAATLGQAFTRSWSRHPTRRRCRTAVTLVDHQHQHQGGYLASYPTPARGSAVPNVTALSASAGVSTVNPVVVGIGSGGRVRLRCTGGSVHLLADLTGWFGALRRP